ncbi:cyclic lactone autoinducer peptide [Paenibacillus tritici]|nr:cyclic lactone autoinducer peptide [Paenibacillus tritici]QUL57605.1 cyclic lactone autoinducer peptide [Paenibacillus tritici]
MKRGIYNMAATALSVLAVGFVSPASIWYVYGGSVPKELLKK